MACGEVPSGVRRGVSRMWGLRGALAESGSRWPAWDAPVMRGVTLGGPWAISVIGGIADPPRERGGSRHLGGEWIVSVDGGGWSLVLGVCLA